MRRLSFRVLAAVFTFALGIALATWWSINYFNYPDQVIKPTDDKPEHDTQTSEVIPPEWQKINMEGKATFYIPSSLKPEILDTPSLYRYFRRDGMDVTMLYRRIGTSAVCIDHTEEKLSKYKISRTKVAGKDATLLNVENAVFGHGDSEDREPLKGITICVPSVGNGEHEFAIVARYKSEQDQQDVRRIIDSMKFP